MISRSSCAASPCRPPSEAEVQAALGPLARRVVVERAGHALLPEQPDAVVAALLAFARDLWR
jgi:pimeloyl-ACP methyl ester carboxylesterase